MTMTLGMITCDTTGPLPLANWWAEQVGGEVADPFEGTFVLVSGGPVMLAFQKVDDPTEGKNRFHLDLTASDLDAEVDRLLGAGAGLVGRRGDEDFRWVTLTDPDGNQFCVAEQGEAEAFAS
ncbi:VOC family protein [Nocardioides sp. BGMRC 2183]|nr:VOC family protein [Nocardioides sp. BGMRC 2183]